MSGSGAEKIKKQTPLSETLPVGSVEKAQFKKATAPPSAHGGKTRIGKRKIARPFFAKTPMHIVLSSHRAKGVWSLKHRKNQASVNSMIYRYAERFKVKVYQASNQGKAVHLLVKAEERKQLADFLRVLAGQIACRVSGAKKGFKRIGKFWDSLCWSRLVNWGRDFSQTRQSIHLGAHPRVRAPEGEPPINVSTDERNLECSLNLPQLKPNPG